MLPTAAQFDGKTNLRKLLALFCALALTTPVMAQEDDGDEPENTIQSPHRHILNKGKRNSPMRAIPGNPRFKQIRQMNPQLRNRNLENLRTEGAEAETEPASEAKIEEPREEPSYIAANTNSSSSGSSTSGNSSNNDQSSIDTAARMKNGKFKFDFNKGTIEDVIKLISDITRKNFIIPEKIKGQKLTILCPTMVSAYEAYQAFLSALEINNLTLVQSGKFYKVTNAKDAIKGPIPTYYDDTSNVPWSDTLVTILLPLKFMDAQNASNIIKGMVSSDGTMTVFAPTNTLIISDYGSNIHRVKGILDKLDQEGGQEETKIIPIENAVATDVAEKLKQLFDVDKKAAANNNNKGKKDAGNDEGTNGGVSISKIIPDDRTNQLIIVANHNSFGPIMDMVSNLDVQLTDDEGQIRVYYLKNAVAEDIANTLSSLAQGKSNNNNNNKNKNKKNNNASKDSAAALFEGEVKITADKATNSLVIVSSARDYKSLKKVLEELDRPRLQVYIEAAIMEVNISNNKQFGTGWHSGIPFDNASGDKNLAQGIGFVQSSSNSTMTTVTSASGVADLFNIFSGAIGGVLGEMITGTIGGTSVTIPSFGVVLKALQSDSNAKIISTPFITATDNEEAEVEVGQKIPFQEGYGSTLGNLAGLAGSNSSALSAYAGLYSRTDRIDVTMKMNITPHINESGKVRLEFDLAIEDYVGKDEATGQPITATRNLKTTITPDDQETVVIGGLVRDRLRESESKIPLLGNIPILGWLFKTRSWDTEKVSLLVMLTPHIIRDKNDMRVIATNRMEEQRLFEAMFYGGSKQYRAMQDYRKKNGLAAILHQEITHQMNYIENGGDGNGEETLITPSGTMTGIDVSEEVTTEFHQGETAEPASTDPSQDEQ